MRDVVLLSHSSPAWRASQLVSQVGYVISFTIRSHLPFKNCVNKFLNFHKVLVVLHLCGPETSKQILSSADSFKKGCCQLQAKVCAQITG